MIRVSGWLALAALVFAPSLAGQVRGVVKNTAGSSLPAVTILLQPGDQSVTSGADGSFVFSNVEPGTYLVTATLRGYVPAQFTFIRESSAQKLPDLVLATVQTTLEVREQVEVFLATSSVSVTKSPQNLLDLPYPVQVIPKALFESRQIQDIKELYRNISGVTDGPYSAMTFRGFVQREIVYNGIRGNPFGSLDADVNDAGFSTTQGRLSNIEFVEVLKGPANVLFGSGQPGGILSFVTRKPRSVPAVEGSFRTGNFQQKGGHLDLTGPLAKNLYGRAAWYQEDRRTFRNNTRNENQHLASGLTWRAGEATSLGFEFEYLNQYLPAYRLRGVPVNASGGWLTNREWTATEPTDFTGLQARVFQARFDHAFTPTARVDAAFRYLNSDRPERYHEPRGITGGTLMTREFRNQLRTNDDWSVTANTFKRAATSLGTHDLAFGFETVHQDWLGRFGTARSASRGGPVQGIDLARPQYGLSSGALFAFPDASFLRQTVKVQRQGYFAQDQIQVLPRLQVLLGGRVERLADDGRDGATALRFRNTAFTGRAGLAYRLAPNTSAFASFSNSFNRASPLAQAPSANGPHDPEVGRQFEAGVKSELFERKVLLTASVFHVRRRNLLRPDPNLGPTGLNESASFPVGRARSQGIELDATGRVTRNLSIIVNYALLATRILEDRTTPAAIGRPLPNAARHAGGLFARYQLARTGTSFSVGGEARGRRYEPYAGILSGGYSIADFGVAQKLGKYLEARMQVANAFDRFYSSVSLFAARAGNMPGDPRTITFSLHFSAARAQ